MSCNPVKNDCLDRRNELKRGKLPDSYADNDEFVAGINGRRLTILSIRASGNHEPSPVTVLVCWGAAVFSTERVFELGPELLQDVGRHVDT
jgi:hypothetical protein